LVARWAYEKKETRGEKDEGQGDQTVAGPKKGNHIEIHIAVCFQTEIQHQIDQK